MGGLERRYHFFSIIMIFHGRMGSLDTDRAQGLNCVCPMCPLKHNRPLSSAVVCRLHCSSLEVDENTFHLEMAADSGKNPNTSCRGQLILNSISQQKLWVMEHLTGTKIYVLSQSVSLI